MVFRNFPCMVKVDAAMHLADRFRKAHADARRVGVAPDAADWSHRFVDYLPGARSRPYARGERERHGI